MFSSPHLLLVWISCSASLLHNGRPRTDVALRADTAWSRFLCVQSIIKWPWVLCSWGYTSRSGNSLLWVCLGYADCLEAFYGKPGTRCASCSCSEVQPVLQAVISSHSLSYCLQGLTGSALFSYSESFILSMLSSLASWFFPQLLEPKSDIIFIYNCIYNLSPKCALLALCSTFQATQHCTSPGTGTGWSPPSAFSLVLWMALE